MLLNVLLLIFMATRPVQAMLNCCNFACSKYKCTCTTKETCPYLCWKFFKCRIMATHIIWPLFWSTHTSKYYICKFIYTQTFHFMITHVPTCICIGVWYIHMCVCVSLQQGLFMHDLHTQRAMKSQKVADYHLIMNTPTVLCMYKIWVHHQFTLYVWLNIEQWALAFAKSKDTCIHVHKLVEAKPQSSQTPNTIYMYTFTWLQVP